MKNDTVDMWGYGSDLLDIYDDEYAQARIKPVRWFK